MKYKIFDLLEERRVRGVDETYYDYVLSDLNSNTAYITYSEFDSVESAYKYITDNKIDMRYKKLTIIPVISIDWEGNINE